MGGKQRRTSHNQSFRQMDARRKAKTRGVVDGAYCLLGKICYRSKPAAARKLIKLKQSVNYQPHNGAPLHVYQCPKCEHWHVGHDTRNYGNG
jgi:hypothetical protein